MAFTQTLTAAQVSKAWTKLVNEHLEPAGPLALNKTDLVAAVNALQSYLWSNRAAINNVLPANVQAGLTTDQKLWLLAIVVVANLEG